MKRKQPNQRTRTKAGTGVPHIDNSLLIHEGQNRRKEEFHLHTTRKRKRPNQQTRTESGTEVLHIDNSPLIHEEHDNLRIMLEDNIVEDQFKRIKQWFGRYIKPRELEKIGDFCDLYQCLCDREIIDLGEYQKLSKALNAVGLQRLGKEIKKTSETIREIRIKKRNNSGSKRKGRIQKTIVKRDWISVRRKWSRIADELLDKRGNKILKRNFEEMAKFFDDMNNVMKSEDLDVKLNICCGVTGKVKEILDKEFTETALTNAQALRRATRVFVERYDASVIMAARGCLRLTLRFTTSSTLKMMWNDYLSGDLSNMLTDNIVTIPMREMAGWEDIFVGVKIDKEQYLNVCRSLPNGINLFEKMSCKDADDTKEGNDNTPSFDYGTCHLPSHAVTGETPQVQTDGWWRRHRHLSSYWKQVHAEPNTAKNRPLPFFPGNDNEDKFDTNEEVISCTHNKPSVHTSVFRHHIDLTCECADDTRKDDENGTCFESETSKLPPEDFLKFRQNSIQTHTVVVKHRGSGYSCHMKTDILKSDDVCAPSCKVVIDISPNGKWLRNNEGTVCTSARIAVYPSDDLVCDLARNIGFEWEDVAAYLGVERPQIDQLKLNSPSDALGQIRNMLFYWRDVVETNNNEERRDKLKKALSRARRNDLADSLR